MKEMRKAGRQKDAAWAMEVFDKAPYVTVSMVRPDGSPYGLPLSLVRGGDNTFYFHCAAEGEKLDCLRSNPTVSLSAVSRCTPKFEPEKTILLSITIPPWHSAKRKSWKMSPRKLRHCFCSVKDSFRDVWIISTRRSHAASESPPS